MHGRDGGGGGPCLGVVVALEAGSAEEGEEEEEGEGGEREGRGEEGRLDSGKVGRRELWRARAVDHESLDTRGKGGREGGRKTRSSFARFSREVFDAV